MTTHTPRPPRDVRLTPRGRRVLALAGALVVLALLVSAVRGCSSDQEMAGAPRQSPAVSAPTASSGPATPPPASATPVPGTSVGPDGMRHSGLTGRGTWKLARLAVPPPRRTSVVHRYVVRVEDGTGLDPVSVARQVSGILNDPRGWTGHQGNSFELVDDPARAEFAIHLASPGRAQQMCLPLDVRRTWSCRSGSTVVLNTDRWLYMTPTYQDLATYRSYLVNHEVGHYIGKGHVDCPRPGGPAPVMMQQSMRLQGCLPNAWPAEEER